MYIYIYYTVKSDNFLWFDFILPQGFVFDNNFLSNIYSYISPLVNQLSNRLIVIWYYLFLQFRGFYNTNLVLFFYSLTLIWSYFRTWHFYGDVSVSGWNGCDNDGAAPFQTFRRSGNAVFNTPGTHFRFC